MAQPVDCAQGYDDWGDYVSEDEEANVVSQTEGENDYFLSPTCYPVTIGELIPGGGRSYRVEHKLGHGSFSTVWLAFEVETNTSVALKIHRTRTMAGQLEQRIRQDLQQTISEPEDCYLVASTSTFSLPGEGPGNSHTVMVLPLLGPDLNNYVDCYCRESSTRLRMAKNVLQAVACLHAHEFVHCDLNDRNVMVSLVPGALDQGPTPSERYKQVGRPQKFPVAEGDALWKAGDLVAPLAWPESMVGKTAFLTDFGLTRRIGAPRSDNWLPPTSYCPPELFHNGFEPTYQSDMWGFMCIFTFLMTNHKPFVGFGICDTLDFMRDTLGPMPREWEGRFKWSSDSSEEEPYGWYDQSRGPKFSLETILDRDREDLVGSRERELILEVMYKGFRYQPLQRLTAQQLLDDASFLELMSMYGIE